ncbi:hypothetical protein ACMUMQ_05640 [Marinomonas sp. 2405UD66-6]|uniref:hypothetical protein n=1 Tax=Marinomonas sp. 2405UD66-6 TaxID=3391834 RepID=UPI0039C90AF2
MCKESIENANPHESIKGNVIISKGEDGSLKGEVEITRNAEAPVHLNSDNKYDPDEKNRTESSSNDYEKIENESKPLKKNEDWLLKIFKIFKISNLIQYTIFIGVLSGIYGFAFQKGMISEMGLGGFSVSYNIEDMYYIAFSVALNKIEGLKENLFFSLGFAFFIFIILSFLLVSIILSKHKGKKEKPKDKNNIGNKCKIFIGLIGAFSISVIMFLIQLNFKILLFIFGLLIFAPGLFGYQSGQDYMKEIKSKELCGTDEKSKECVQITKNGLLLTGEIILETNDAFFIRKKDYFLHISKIGANCAFSHYENPKAEKQEKEKQPNLDPEIEAICFNQQVSQKVNDSQG